MSKLITENDLKGILDAVLPYKMESTYVVTSIESGWTEYSTSTTPKVYTYGKIAMLSGVLKNTASKTLNATDTLIMTLPVSPIYLVYSRQTWSDGTYHIRIAEDGKVYFARASNNGGTTYPSISSGCFFPFTVMFIMS